MDIRQLVDQQVERSRALARAAIEAEEVGQPPPGPVITISRQIGTGGRLVAERLVERLGWSLWHKDLVDAIAHNADISRRVVESFDEKTVSEIEVLTRTLTGQPEVGGFLYQRHLARALLAIARHGYAIILGRGANFLLPDALNIRIVASEKLQIENLVKYKELSRSEALDCIRHSEKERADFIHHAYQRNIDDPRAYDVILRIDRFDIDGATELIISALEHLNR